ncbi:MAG: helix-turn-helix domain-containing protein [Faecalibacterium prausnitzii]|nr:helix-turn-helix domain-containing protein [Faecalibacterium prausnitzii]
MTENERVRAVRQALGLSQQEFGSRIGIKISAMSYLESGKSRLTESNAILICKEFNVSREWLLNGTGEMFLPESSDSLDALAEQYDLTPLEREIFENYCKLSKAQRLAFWDVMQKIVGSSAQSGSAEESAPGSEVAAAEAAYEKNFGTASGTPDAEATSMHEDTG